MFCWFFMLHSLASFCAEGFPTNSSDDFGYELLLAKMDFLEYKFLEMQVEMKEHSEAILYNQNRNKQDVLDQTSDILEQQKMTANHDAIKQSIFELRPKKHPSDNSKLVEVLIKGKAVQSQKSETIASCEDEQTKQSGLYSLSVENSTAFQVYCEQRLQGGGWIVIQNRFDGSVDFYRNWVDYKEGFGNLSGEFWMGLEKIHLLTSQKPRMLLVYLEDFGGISKFAVYDNFEVGSENEKYILKNVLRLYGTLDDSLVIHKESTFTTRDVDFTLCVDKYFGAWWNSKKCYYSNLNGPYLTIKADDTKSMNWHGFSNKHENLKISRMMIK
ncbi:ficolin-1 [Culex quinquefasciatus]|uniref:ficolin-1 n=1 Tax=Culex quinquefasciatus TaxID=7176 RepID=UPI0018E3A972|nr:ficolin-1 [Culex quinquefasciatus]